MELTRAPEQIFNKQDILYIKRYHHLIDIGSETTCYNMNSKQVIKFFDMTTDPSSKLLIPDNIYGNNTFVFIDAIQKYCNKIIAYTMKLVTGTKLGTSDSITLFYQLSYNMLLEYITTLLQDCKELANHGIQVYDCYKSNIILSPTGFRQIDCVDFLSQDKDPKLIEQENINLMCQTIWDNLISPQLSAFISKTHLKQEDFTHYPYDFLKELRNITEQRTNAEITTLDDIKKLCRKK